MLIKIKGDKSMKVFRIKDEDGAEYKVEEVEEQEVLPYSPLETHTSDERICYYDEQIDQCETEYE